MKKQHFKSLKLNKKSIARFEEESIKGGITGARCEDTYTCVPETVVHTCQLTDVRTCTLSYIQCTN